MLPLPVKSSGMSKSAQESSRYGHAARVKGTSDKGPTADCQLVASYMQRRTFNRVKFWLAKATSQAQLVSSIVPLLRD